MDPRLVAITGDFEGAVFPLPEGETWIGRDITNQVRLNDPLVSRRHCVVIRHGTEFVLRDQVSSNGTFVNDQMIREREWPLCEGDRIRIGDARLLFLLYEARPTDPATRVQLDDGNIAANTVIKLLEEEAVYLQPDKLAALPTSARVSADLQALLKFSTTLNKHRQFGELQQRILELLFEVFPADFGALILEQRFFRQAERIAWREREPGAQGSPPPISSTVINQVRSEKAGWLSNNVGQTKPLSGAHSLVATPICSLLAVPLLLYGEVAGVLYLDSKIRSASFDENHLQLLTAIAGMTAVALDNAAQWEQLDSQARRLQEELKQQAGMIGDSPAMESVYRTIKKAAPSTATILIRGESGTGKEVAARAIHELSERKSRTFISVNCASLPDETLASQLFGHKRGAFTNAYTDHVGFFEAAHGGTLFLDEIGDISPAVQVSLLRALQEKVITRLGETKTRPVDARIIAATNRPLENLIQEGRFRADLFYRLNVIPLTMPALRNRREDILLLAEYFIGLSSRKCKRRVRGLDSEAGLLLTSYAWPGNVRELENAIERAVVLGSDEWIRPEDLPESLLDAALPATLPIAGYHATVKEAKRQIILRALHQANGNFTEAAKELGLHPNNLHRLVRDLGVREFLKK